MGFLRRLIGLPDPNDPLANLMRSVDRSATLAGAPHDNDLWTLAKQRADHISPKAVCDEYDRLILQKYR
jgi:hypothetical protein